MSCEVQIGIVEVVGQGDLYIGKGRELNLHFEPYDKFFLMNYN